MPKDQSEAGLQVVSSAGTPPPGMEPVTLDPEVALALVQAERDYVASKLRDVAAAKDAIEHRLDLVESQVSQLEAPGKLEAQGVRLETVEAKGGLLEERVAEVARVADGLRTEFQLLREQTASIAGKQSELEGRQSELAENQAELRRELRSSFALAITAVVRSQQEQIESVSDYQAIAGSVLFDGRWYLARYEDVATAKVDPVEHYLSFGGIEGRATCPLFDGAAYLEAHPDVAAARVNPLLHFLRYGVREGREFRGPPEPRALSAAAASPITRPIKPGPRFWFYVGDSVDWLNAHSHLTGVGKVSMELFFAANVDQRTSISPCIATPDGAGLVAMTSSATRARLAQKSGQADGDAPRTSTESRKPEAGDHVFFTGLCWTPMFSRLFIALAEQNIDFSVLVHDIIPIEHPDLVGAEYSNSFSKWLAVTLTTANVIYVSHPEVKNQILRWGLLSGLDIKPRIVPIAFGVRSVAADLAASTSDPRPDLSELRPASFVLSVGTIDRRKNQLFLCRIWKRLVDHLGASAVPPLVLAGRQDLDLLAEEPDLASLLADKTIRVIQGLSDAEISELYRSCLFTAFASVSEGYGLPVAESHQYGKLCLSSDLPAIREHARDLPWYFDPAAPDEALEVFIRALQSPEDRKKAELRIAKEFRPRRWADTFSTMLETAKGALDEPDAGSGGNLPPHPGAAPPAVRGGLANAAKWCVSEDPEVSILIINWNAASLTLECVRQIWANTTGRRYEVIIADNGSDTADVARLRDLGRGVRLIDIGCNRFFGEANNIAAEAARGRYLCLLNNDAFVQAGWLEALVEPLEADAALGATGPMFLYPDGTIQEAGAVLDASGYPIRFGRGDKGASPEILSPKVVDYISAAALLLRRDSFMTAGGFDLAYEPAYYEDTDLCLKLRALGQKVLYCPEARVVHIEGSSANGDPVAEARRKALGDINRDKFIARWGDYFRSRSADDLAPLKDRILSSAKATRKARPRRKKTAAIYTPYALTPGGGERYLLTMASALARQFDLTVVTPQPYSHLRLRNLGEELGLDLSGMRAAVAADYWRESRPDLMVTMGNHVAPPISGRGRTNIFHCQFPFPFPSNRAPTEDEAAAVASYDAIVVNSNYTAGHVRAKLDVNKLPQLPVHLLYPPVQMFEGDSASKKRFILTVGRFFVGGHAKRHDALISAFKDISERFEEPVELHIAGSSTPSPEHMDYLASLMRSAEGYPIHFHVNCSAQKLARLYAEASVYWHGTGLYEDLAAQPERAEHFGISLVEAMSAQALPFAMDAGGPQEIIESGKSGFLYSTLGDLGERTVEILNPANKDRATAMRQAAGARAQDFSSEKFEQAVEALVQNLV